MKTFLITGGAGFVGSSLAILLKENYSNIHVIALDNLKRRGSELNIKRLQNNGIEFWHGDIRNTEDLNFKNIDYLIECSAEPSVLAGFDGSPDYLLNTNLGGTIHCLELARKCGARIIFLSTSRVYPIHSLNQLKYREDESRFHWEENQSFQGFSPDGINEQFNLNGARSLYGTSKLASELIIQEYGEMYNLEYVINRCGVIAGPWQMGKTDQGVVALWAAKHLSGNDLSYIGFNGSGKQVRDVLHIRDLFSLIKIQIDDFPKVLNETFNVGGGRANSVSLKEMTGICRQVTGKSINIGSEPENRPADIRIYISDNSKVNQATGWTPQISPTQTIDDVCRWIRKHQSSLDSIIN